MDDKEITCRGSIMLGTGCGTCSRCKTEIDSMRDKLSQKTEMGAPRTDQREKIPAGAVGWTCPRCGRGNGPFTSTCPCLPMPAPVVTC